MARNTRTGGVLEQMVLPALDQGGYASKVQVHLGQRLGLGKHMVDAVAEKDGRKILLSVKWQQVSGTAEQKVPFEIICLIEAMEADASYEKAYVVLESSRPDQSFACLHPLDLRAAPNILAPACVSSPCRCPRRRSNTTSIRGEVILT